MKSLDELAARGYNTDGWQRWQQGGCLDYARGLVRSHPHLSFGTLHDDEDVERHHFAHDETHAYDSAGKHPLPYLGVHPDHQAHGAWLHDDESDYDEPDEDDVREAQEHAARHGIVEGRHGLRRTAAREPGSTNCWVCGGGGDEPGQEGSECPACDGSGYLTPGEQRRWTCPEGMRITKDPSDGFQHADGSIGCDDSTGATVGDVVRERTRAAVEHKYRIRGWAGQRVAGVLDLAPYFPAGGVSRYPELPWAKHPQAEHAIFQGHEHPLADVELANLRRTQDHITARSWDAERAPRSHPVVVRHQGADWLVDGHNRAVHEMNQGATHLRAHLVELHGHRTATRSYPPRRHENGGVPFKRIFGPTYGLDRRLFDDDDVLKPEVRDYLMNVVGWFWDSRYPSWREWAIVYFAGSEASEWTSEDRIGNNDFDCLIGVHYRRMRELEPALADLDDLAITDQLNDGLKHVLDTFTSPVWVPVRSTSWTERAESDTSSASTVSRSKTSIGSWKSKTVDAVSVAATKRTGFNSGRSITTTRVVPGRSLAASASGASSASDAMSGSATSVSPIFAPHSTMWTEESPPTAPDGWEYIGPFDGTFYVNPGSYHIADIKPYAAYDVTHDRWAVKPPHLPGWSIRDFPQGHGLEDYCWGIEDAVRATLDMPEPYRHQEGFALWEFVHGQRSDAFGPQGEGWYDTKNVIEKWLSQKNLMQALWEVRQEAVNNPHLLDSPADWSNTPYMAALARYVFLSPAR